MNCLFRGFAKTDIPHELQMEFPDRLSAYKFVFLVYTFRNNWTAEVEQWQGLILRHCVVFVI